MAKNYVNKKTGVNHKVRPQSQQNHYGMFLIVIIIIIVGFYLLNQSGIWHQMKHTFMAALFPAPSPDSKSIHAENSHQPHFEFYTLLPQNDRRFEPQRRPDAISQVKTSVIPAVTAQADWNVESPKVAIKPPSNNRYLLQIAAYRTLKEADHLKAQLIFLGYNVSIENFKTRDNAWFRVKVGPYANLNEAKGAAAKLKQNKYNSILRRAS